MPETWSRRSLLATLSATALAGCPAASDDSDPTPTDTPTETATATATPESPDTPAPPESIDSEWPLPDHDRGRSNYAAEATGPTEAVAELWSVTADATLSAPVVAGETVYAGGDDGVVRALDVRTGAERWQQSVGPTAGTPRIVEGTVYVPGDDTIVALDPGEGTERWAVETEPLGDFVAAGHGLYYVTDDPGVDQIDEEPSVVALGRGGEEHWRTAIEDPWEATVFAADDRVFVPTDTYDRRPWMLGVETGDVLNDRRPMRGADFPSGRFYRGGHVVSIDGFFGNLRSIAVAAGASGWSRDIGKGGTYAASGSGDRVYVLHNPYEESGVRLLALSVASEGVEWEVSGLSFWTQPAVVADEAVVVNTEDGLRCFDPDDGGELWSGPSDVGGSALALVDDLLVTTDGSTVRALRPP
jgi:hypothetical protein